MSNRREFLKSAGLIAIMAGVSSCAQRTGLFNTETGYPSAKYLPQIRLSSDRIIKETVGLRPFRSLGPRIEKEQLGSKTIIHNYGHGGSGWSLSWGTAMLATELADNTREENIAVLGAGVIGLTTSRLLQKKGYKVTIFAKDLAPNVTSSKATGTWSPTFKLIDKEKLTPEFINNFGRAVAYSYTTHQNHVGINEVAKWVDNYQVRNSGPHQGGHESIPELDQYNQYLPKRVTLTKNQHCFDADEVTRGSQLVFNIPTYLKLMMDEFLEFGGQVEIAEMTSIADIQSLPFNAIVNCTGLGSKKLFGDEAMTPIRGQLSFLMPQPEVKYSLSTDFGYFIPREDGLVMGSSDNTRVGSWDLNPDSAQTEKAVVAMQEILAGMKS